MIFMVGLMVGGLAILIIMSLLYVANDARK
jgi:hypothetical protein